MSTINASFLASVYLDRDQALVMSSANSSASMNPSSPVKSLIRGLSTIVGWTTTGAGGGGGMLDDRLGKDTSSSSPDDILPGGGFSSFQKAEGVVVPEVSFISMSDTSGVEGRKPLGTLVLIVYLAILKPATKPPPGWE